MAKAAHNTFLPDYSVPPGEVLEDYLDACGMTQSELSDRLGFSKKTINEIIKGKAPVTPDTSLKLERVFGRPAHFWNNLEQQYREDIARIAEQERLRNHLDWLKSVPVHQMAKLGFIQKFSNKLEQLNEVLKFFAVASPEQWRVVWEEHQVAYRQQSEKFEPCAKAVSAWLRQGEIQAHRINCAPYEKKKFQETLTEIRTLTRAEPQEFQPKLIELCANTGVAIAFVPDLPKTGVSGATRWIGEKALIQLSLRYKSNDQLWFTFFHEAGHILKHGRKEIFLEGNGMNGEKEEEANQFARDFLIPPKAYREFTSCGRPTLKDVSRFAGEVDIAPGIVVGRLQHEGLLAMDIGNKLKVFYRWA